MQNKGYIQSRTLKILRSKKRDERGKKKERGYPMQRSPTRQTPRGKLTMMFLYRDNHMQNKGCIQSGTLKILLSVHAPKRGTKGVKKKERGYPMQRLPTR